MKKIFFILITTLFIFPEFWVNDKPLYLVYKGRSYFPIVQTIDPQHLEQSERIYPNFKDLNAGDVEVVVWPFISWGMNESDFQLPSYPSAPDGRHLLGTDDRGRDLLARLIYAVRMSVLFSFISVFVLIVLSVGVGVGASFCSSRFDFALSGTMDIFESIPQWMVFLLVSVYWGQKPWVLGALFVIFNWTTLALLAKSQTQKVWKSAFIEATLATGSSYSHTIVYHILPHIIPSQLILVPKLMLQLILLQVGLGFLGFGFSASSADFGEILSQSERYLETSWWLTLYPCALITLLLAGLYSLQQRYEV